MNRCWKITFWIVLCGLLVSPGFVLPWVPANVAQAAAPRVDLNTATADELMELPGVGEATAKKIIAGRPYKSVEGLADAGVNATTIEKIKDLVMVKAPPRAAAKQADKPADKAPVAKASADKPAGEGAAPSGQKVNLNTATQEQLEALPGVGEVTAKKIIAGRPYRTYEQVEAAGVSAATMEKIRPLVSLRGDSGSPKAESPARSGAEASDKPEKAPAKRGAAAEADNASAKKEARPEADKAPKASKADDAETPVRTPPRPGLVWLNTDYKIFHREGSHWFGRTKEGKFMTEAEAIKAGGRAAQD